MFFYLNNNEIIICIGDNNYKHKLKFQCKKAKNNQKLFGVRNFKIE